MIVLCMCVYAWVYIYVLECTCLIIKVFTCMSHLKHIYMYVQLLRQGKARQLRLRKTPLFSEEELPQAGFEPATLCVLGRCSTN